MAVVLIIPDDPEYHIPSRNNYRRPLCDAGLTRREGMLTTVDTLRSHPLRPCILCHPDDVSDTPPNQEESIEGVEITSRG